MMGRFIFVLLTRLVLVFGLIALIAAAIGYGLYWLLT